MQALIGSLLVALAAFLFGTDTIVRYPASSKLDTITLVFAENALAFLIFLPIGLIKYGKKLLSLTPVQWLSVAVIGIGGAAAGNIAYTVSIHRLGPSVPTLMLKLQPLLVVILASVLLKERHKLNIFPWPIVAILSAAVISFPELDFRFFGNPAYWEQSGLLAGAIAVVLWSFSTVSGKHLATACAPGIVVFWRWTAATAALGLFLLLRGQPIHWSEFTSREVYPSLLYLSAIAGVGGMWIYYHGLRRIPASIATFIELIYPLAGVILSVIFLKSELSAIQIGGAALLLFAVLLIAIPKDRAKSE